MPHAAFKHCSDTSPGAFPRFVARQDALPAIANLRALIQVCKPYALTPDAQVSPADALQAFEIGTRPVVSSLKFPQALLVPSTWRGQETDLARLAKPELRMGRSPQGIDGTAPLKECV